MFKYLLPIIIIVCLDIIPSLLLEITKVKKNILKFLNLTTFRRPLLSPFFGNKLPAV
jgi:hypothetical protein